MFLRVTVHIRPEAYLAANDPRANTEGEFVVRDDEQGAGEAVEQGGKVIERAIEKFHRAKEEKERKSTRGD